MKKSFSLLLLIALSASVFAAKGIVLTQKYIIPGSDHNITVTWYITENRCKLKMQYSDKDVNTISWFIPNVKSGNVITYSEGALPAGTQQTYFTLPVQSIKGDVSAATVEKTGETKVISGMNCEKIISKTASTTTEIWVLKDFNVDMYQYAAFFKSSGEIQALASGKVSGIPVASVVKDNNGNIAASFEAISIVAKDLPDSEFAPPSDYKSAEDISKAKKN